MSKRLIIDGAEPVQWDAAGTRQGYAVEYVIPGSRYKYTARIPGEIVTAVEDAPLALPTEPGTRFWGSFDKTAPCWWFVRTERGTEGVWYVSQHVDRGGHPTGINSTSMAVTEGRLVRLPDPEETP